MLVAALQGDPIRKASPPESRALPARGELSDTVVALNDALHPRHRHFWVEHVEAAQRLHVAVLQRVLAPVVHTGDPLQTTQHRATVILLDDRWWVVPKVSELLVKVVRLATLVDARDPALLSHEIAGAVRGSGGGRSSSDESAVRGCGQN